MISREVAGRDVKPLQGVGQGGCGQIADQQVKQTKAQPQLPRLMSTADHIHAGAVGHVGDRAPHPPGWAAMPGVALLFGAHQLRQVPAALLQQGMGSAALELALDVLTEHLQVLHHQLRLVKHLRIDPLQHRRPIHRLHQEGVVDVAIAQGLHRLHAAAAMKGFGDGDQLSLRRRRHTIGQGVDSTCQCALASIATGGQSLFRFQRVRASRSSFSPCSRSISRRS